MPSFSSFCERDASVGTMLSQAQTLLLLAASSLHTGTLPHHGRPRSRAVHMAEPSDLAALKRAFFAADSADSGERRASDMMDMIPSIMFDVPLCRAPREILPYHQRVLNVSEPQHTLLFESVLASALPHHYVHLHLRPTETPTARDAINSLDDPELGLWPGSKAALTGTLMRIVATRRESGGRLLLTVQGLSRVQVLRRTQLAPYSRADVTIIDDAETLRASACTTRRWLRATGAMRATDEPGRVRLALAAAAAEEQHWRDFEFDAPSATATAAERLCACSANGHQATSESAAAVDAAVARAAAAMEEASRLDDERGVPQQAANGSIARFLHPAAVDVRYAEQNWHSEWLRSLLDEIEDTAVQAEADLLLASVPQDDDGSGSAEGRPLASERALEELARQAEALDEAMVRGDAATLAALEIQAWLELDCLVNPDGPRGPGGAEEEEAAPTGSTSAPRRVFLTDGDVPPALLALLPPPPELGWPAEFGLARLASQLEVRARLESLFSSGGGEGEVPRDDGAGASGRTEPDVYPARRRATRLSYAIWAVLAPEGSPLQRVLEVTSTAERLRFAILRMRLLTGRQLKPPET